MIHSSAQNIFPIRINPQEDELFSSWFSRLALAHGLSGNQLSYLIWDKKTLGTRKRDFDRIHNKKIFEHISEKTGVLTEEIINTSLFSYIGYLFSKIPIIERIPWITPCWYTANQKSYGMQFCWECLKEDDIPYFRRKWRLAFVVTCIKHKIVLSDRCPQCIKPINYFLTPTMPIHFCSFCGFDLRKVSSIVPSDVPSPIEIEYQAHLEYALKEKLIENQIGYIYSTLYFKSIYSLMRHLYDRGERFYKPIAELYRIEGLPSKIFNSDKAMESYSIPERRFLNFLVNCILNDWHQDFAKLCKGNKIQFEKLDRLRNIYFAFWYSAVIDDYI